MLNESRGSNPEFQVIFVYGSLKRGQTLHYLLRDLPFVGEAWTIAEYRLFHLGAYPGLVQSDSGISVQGELFPIPAIPSEQACKELHELHFGSKCL